MWFQTSLMCLFIHHLGHDNFLVMQNENYILLLGGFWFWHAYMLTELSVFLI